MINLYNEDCLKILKKIKDNSIDLIITDPPYRCTPKGCSGNMGGMMKDLSGKIFKNNDIEFKDYSKEFYRILKDDSHLYIMTNNKNLIDALNIFTESGFKFIKSIIWDKKNKISGRFYMSQYEYILFFRKGKAKQINNCGTSDIISIQNKKSKDINGNNLHDTEKPVKLMEILIENSTKEEDLVLDPFLGIGASGIAAKNLNRNFIGIEIDKNYFQIAKERIGG